MVKKRRQAGSSKISPTVHRVISPDRDRRADAAAMKLTKTQVAELKQIVQRRLVPTEPFEMANAITALAAAERSYHVANILGRFLSDESQTPTDRAVAAINLRFTPGRTAQNHLVENLRARDRLVRLQVIKSLGTFGDADALTSLQRMRLPKDAAVRRQQSFAQALIAHRLGLAERYLAFRRGAKRTPGANEDMITLRLRPKLKKTVQRDRERLRDSTYGLEIGDHGFGLRAGKASWTVFLNREIEERGGLEEIFERPWITALLARWDLRTHLSAVQYVVLTDPAPRSTEIAVVRTDGELFYSGRMTRTGGLLRFEIRDVERPGTAPTNVRGRLTKRGIELEAVVPFALRRNTRSGDEVVMPASSTEAVGL